MCYYIGMVTSVDVCIFKFKNYTFSREGFNIGPKIYEISYRFILY